MIASVPLLKAGYPPIFIGAEQRSAYVEALEKVIRRSVTTIRYSSECIPGLQRRPLPSYWMFRQRDAIHDRIYRITGTCSGASRKWTINTPHPIPTNCGRRGRRGPYFYRGTGQCTYLVARSVSLCHATPLEETLSACSVGSSSWNPYTRSETKKGYWVLPPILVSTAHTALRWTPFSLSHLAYKTLVPLK